MSKAHWRKREVKFGPPSYIFYLGNVPVGSCVMSISRNVSKVYIKVIVPTTPAVEEKLKEMGGVVHPTLEKAQEVLVYVIDTWIKESTLTFTQEG